VSPILGYNPRMTDERAARDALQRLLAATWEPGSLRFTTEFPWASLVQLAQDEGVAPMVHAATREASTAIPDEHRETLAESYYQIARDNVLASLDLAPVLAALSSLGIPALLVKGLALAGPLYGNVALRQMTDLDLVVPRDHAPTAWDVLLGLGYQPEQVEIRPGAHLAYNIQRRFFDPERQRATISIHWHLLDVPYYVRQVPMAWFWEHTEPEQIAGHQVQVLNAEADLLYLAAHLALHHRFDGLRWFVDLALLVHQNTPSLDWTAIAHTAQEFELLLALRETLDRLAAYWPSLPLDAPRARLHALQPTALEARLFRLLTAEPRSPLLDFYTDVLCLPDLPSRLRFVFSNTFPQRAYMARRYGAQRAWQLPFWYAFRLGDGLLKLLRTLPQALRLRAT
jgi:hypothetical protein